MGRLTDTTQEAERVLAEAYRRMPPGRRWLNLGEMYLDARALHAAGMRLRHPQATDQEIARDWIAQHVGALLPRHSGGAVMTQPISNLREVREVIRVLVQLGIPYALGGSMASSVHGRDRYTRDADLTAEPFPGKEELLAGAFGPDYYVSVHAVKDAILRRASFNIINTTTGFKVDVFIQKATAFEQSAFQRRVTISLPDDPAQPVTLHAAEDVVLFKLRWYRLGNQISEQQWRDVLGVLQVQASKLDDAYLDLWAADLGVADLLARARQEAAL
jgi:hypothetical protein